ncbi:MAG: hypothetical protein AAGM22_31655 [Acidobacteriota bacterium]
MKTRIQRVVVVTRPTELSLLLARHGTRSQAEFFLSCRGQDLEEVEERHRRFEAALARVMSTVPMSWRRARIQRADLDRFLFEPEDTVVALGQDGLVANVAKYLDGQPVLGVNPDPAAYDGVLVPLAPEAVADLLVPASRGQASTESRTMVAASTGGGRELVALNEIFVGHRSHQSARYRLGDTPHRGPLERQSSSGLVVASGSGATGWARSIHRRRKTDVVLPGPTERRLAFFVREAFPSVATGTSRTDGSLGPDQDLEVISEMNDGGVVFGDGIEGDFLRFDWGTRLQVTIAPKTLELVRA